jgi:hypothetical protein
VRDTFARWFTRANTFLKRPRGHCAYAILLSAEGERGMQLGARGFMVVLVASVLMVESGTAASADPLPGFDFDPDQLAERMGSCLDSAARRTTF